MTDAFYQWARRIHLASSSLVALIAVTHSALTPSLYQAWTPEAVWFLGTGLALLLLASLNLSHIGVQPCRMPTTRLVRVTNSVFVVFAGAACAAIPEPQAYALFALLVLQALMSHRTLPGPSLPHEGQE